LLNGRSTKSGVRGCAPWPSLRTLTRYFCDARLACPRRERADHPGLTPRCELHQRVGVLPFPRRHAGSRKANRPHTLRGWMHGRRPRLSSTDNSYTGGNRDCLTLRAGWRVGNRAAAWPIRLEAPHSATNQEPDQANDSEHGQPFVLRRWWASSPDSMLRTEICARERQPLVGIFTTRVQGATARCCSRLT
jgi:hypothetical protein